MAEIIICSNCQRKLQVPDQYLGQTVQCPECGQMFVASATTVSAAPPSADPYSGGAARPAKLRGVEDDEDDYPKPRRRRFEDDDDYDDFDRPPRIRHDFLPHRGGLIIALGLIGLVGGLFVCGFLLVAGPFAWVMGTADLREMRAGRMDPSGESQVRTGQVCGIISTVILIIGVLVIGLFILAEVGRF
jgi:hypothetical protein